MRVLLFRSNNINSLGLIQFNYLRSYILFYRLIKILFQTYIFQAYQECPSLRLSPITTGCGTPQQGAVAAGNVLNEHHLPVSAVEIRCSLFGNHTTVQPARNRFLKIQDPELASLRCDCTFHRSNLMIPLLPRRSLVLRATKSYLKHIHIIIKICISIVLQQCSSYFKLHNFIRFQFNKLFRIPRFCNLINLFKCFVII